MRADTRVRAPAGRAPKWKRLTHEAASLESVEARLTARRAEADPRVKSPAGGWKYGAREIALLPEGTNPQPGTLYEIHYPAKNPRDETIGHVGEAASCAATRAGKPARSGISGRARVRQLVERTLPARFHPYRFDQDESGRKVFDGVFSHIAGGGGVFLNYEFGQPVPSSTLMRTAPFRRRSFHSRPRA